MKTKQIAESVIQQLEDAWNAGDGEAFGAAYSDHASFVTIRGDFVHGAAGIAAGHDEIFSTIYAGSRNHMEVMEAQPLGDDVIIANSRSTLESPAGPLKGVHHSMSTSVLVRDGGSWRVAATHNTLIAP